MKMDLHILKGLAERFWSLRRLFLDLRILKGLAGIYDIT